MQEVLPPDFPRGQLADSATWKQIQFVLDNQASSLSELTEEFRERLKEVIASSVQMTKLVGEEAQIPDEMTPFAFHQGTYFSMKRLELKPEPDPSHHSLVNGGIALPIEKEEVIPVRQVIFRFKETETILLPWKTSSFFLSEKARFSGLRMTVELENESLINRIYLPFLNPSCQLLTRVTFRDQKGVCTRVLLKKDLAIWSQRSEAIEILIGPTEAKFVDFHYQDIELDRSVTESLELDDSQLAALLTGWKQLFAFLGRGMFFEEELVLPDAPRNAKLYYFGALGFRGKFSLVEWGEKTQVRTTSTSSRSLQALGSKITAKVPEETSILTFAEVERTADWKRSIEKRVLPPSGSTLSWLVHPDQLTYDLPLQCEVVGVTRAGEPVPWRREGQKLIFFDTDSVRVTVTPNEESLTENGVWLLTKPDAEEEQTVNLIHELSRESHSPHETPMIHRTELILIGDLR